MQSSARTWALILAAGQGTRLQGLTTTDAGIAVPKQFCSLWDGPSLFEETVQRAYTVASASYTCAVLADQHRHWWERLASQLAPANRIVQPQNRGTANGILLPLLQIHARDPEARIVILPSDHHVNDEPVLTQSLRQAVLQLSWDLDEIVLLGFRPAEADPQLGYILPGAADGRGALSVTQFVEKPTPIQAHQIIEHGGLWNAFILSATAKALLALFERRMPTIVKDMQAALRKGELAALYETLPSIDFSRHILQGQEAWLRLLAVPHCGWTDLGTPERIAKIVTRASRHAPAVDVDVSRMSLAAQYQRRGISPCHAALPA